MTLSLYTATIPSYLQILTALSGLLNKTEDHCAEQGIEPAAMIEARLAEDMLPFGYQIKATVGHSVGAIAAVREGSFSPDRSAWPTDFAGLQTLVASARATLEAIKPDDLNGAMGRPMRFAMGEMCMDFLTEEFLLSFSQPNFYFHASTAYAIARWKGVPLGKRDYLGAVRLIR